MRADYGSCSLVDQLPMRAASATDAVKGDDNGVDEDDDDYAGGKNGAAHVPDGVANDEEASIIDEYFRLHHVVATASGFGDVTVPRAYNPDDAAAAHWPDQSAIAAAASGSAVTSLSRPFEDLRNRKYLYDFVPTADVVHFGAFATSGVEARPPPPCYPTKREDVVVDGSEVAVRQPDSAYAARVNKFYAGSCPSPDAYFAQYGAGAFPVIIDQSQYGGGGSGVLSNAAAAAARQQYYLSADEFATGSGNSCAAGYLSVDVGGLGPSVLRPLGLQCSTAAWPAAAFRQ